MRVGLLVILASSVAFADAKPPAAVSKHVADWAKGMLDGSYDHEAAGVMFDFQQDLMGPAKLTPGTPSSISFDTCAVVAVEVTVRSHRHPEMMVDGRGDNLPPRPWHLLELLAVDGANVAEKAVGWYTTMPDSSLKDDVYNYVKTMPVEKSPSTVMGWLAHPDDVARHLSNDPKVTVFGTSAKDKAVGPPAAKKLLGSWNKLQLEIVRGELENDLPREVTVGDCTAATARLRMKYQDGAIVLHGFIVAHKVADGWEVVGLQYATDRVSE